jgi:hypothetical protein
MLRLGGISAYPNLGFRSLALKQKVGAAQMSMVRCQLLLSLEGYPSPRTNQIASIATVHLC